MRDNAISKQNKTKTYPHIINTLIKVFLPKKIIKRYNKCHDKIKRTLGGVSI